MHLFSELGTDIFQTIFESVSEGIVIVNQQQQIVSTNASANEMFGYTAEEIVEQPLSMLIPREYHKEHTGHVNRFMDHGQKRSMGVGRDLYGQHKDGSRFPVEAGLSPFIIDGKSYVMALVIDISVRKKHQQEMVALNAQLEEKISERTEDLRQSVNELEAEVQRRKQAEEKMKTALKKERELNTLKTKFLSLVSHEFKTPLSGILTSSTLAGKYTSEEQQDKRMKHLKTIQSKVKYLNNILNDFLSIERLESGKVSYQIDRFPLSKVINEVIYEANMILKDGQRIHYPENVEGITIEFDEKALNLGLTNVINNAIKYSPEGSDIYIEVVQNTEGISIVVTDQGIGIPESEQHYIFNRYFRAENVLLQQGTGIGLNIVRSHLEKLGGSITFSSKEGEGSRFIIQLPAKPSVS